ncbi:MAG: hypothetical protein R2693_10105 [Nocardioidaceae bacterium]
MIDDIRKRGWEVIAVSAASHEGLRTLSYAMAQIVADRRAEIQLAPAAPERIVSRPEPRRVAPDAIRETGRELAVPWR